MKFTVVSHSAVPSGDVARAGQVDTMIVYTTDQGRTDAVLVPGAAPEDSAIIAAVNANENTKARLVGRTFEG